MIIVVDECVSICLPLKQSTISVLPNFSSGLFRGYVWLSIQYFLGLIWAYLDQIKPWVLSWLFCEWCCPCLFGSIYTILRESWNFDSSPLIPFDWCLSYSSDWSLGCMLMSAGCQYLLHLEFLCCCGLRVLFGFFQKHSGLFGYTFHVYFNGWSKVVVLVCLMIFLVITRLYLW